MPGIYTELIDPENFSFLAFCNAACRLIILTGGGTITATGYLRAHLVEIGNVEGLDVLALALATACGGLHAGLNPYLSNMMPTVDSNLNDQEKCLAWLNGIESIVGTAGNGANGVAVENAEAVCLALSTATQCVQGAAYTLLEP
jgi:hypothetical protein